MQDFREWLSDVSPGKGDVFRGGLLPGFAGDTIDFDASSLTLKVNGMPVSGQRLQAASDKPSVTPLSTPGKQQAAILPAIFPILGSPSPRSPTQPLAKFFLHVNNVCNLRCTYCYEQDLPYDTIREKHLPDARIEEVCQFIAASAGNSEGAQVTFFGGEPFLSFGKIVALHSRLEVLLGERPVYPNVVTNGTLLSNEQLDYLVKHRFDVMVSFDGLREYNDKQRPGVGGISTFDQTIANIRRMVSAGVKKVSARITYGQGSLDLLASIRAVAELGVHDLAFRPIMDDTPVDHWSDWATHRNSLRAVAEFYLERLVDGRPVIINNVHEVVRRLVLQQPKTDYCDWGKTCSITPDGDIFPCTHFVGMPEFHMGSIREGLNETVQKRLQAATKIENLPCQTCALKHVCGGGCRGCSQHVHHDIFREDDYCEARRELFSAVVSGIGQMVRQERWQAAFPFIHALMTEGNKKHSCDRFS